MKSAPTCLLDLPPPLLDALRRVAPKERLPKISYVLSVVAGVVMYVLYGTVADAVERRAASPSPPQPVATEASVLPSEQSASVPPAPSASSNEERPSPSAPASVVAADSNRPKASTGTKRKSR
jgi:hypothetical protein